MGFFGRSTGYRYTPLGEFYCPGCRQTSECQSMETLTVIRLLGVPVRTRSEDAGLVRCLRCGGVFDRDVTAHSPTVTRDGLKPALLAVVLAMMDPHGEEGEGENCPKGAGVSQFIEDVTGVVMDADAMALETRRYKAYPDALGERLKRIAPYLANAEKRMLLESAHRVAQAMGYVSGQAALLQRIASLLEVPDSLVRAAYDAASGA
ncbi:hypothetical protein MSL71_2930 [Desulfoluna butyratoxydans]|uniref:Uncharacterized protein n=2 Tax=Desulfoluna butyratoxydans TaxID=231438 RepID=A0A4U8YM85_9BACT|nr:hypothetical protein MSL71_2930 [Desulfoluna butyratoxydans]